MNSNLERFQALIDAWTLRKDIDGVLACMTEDIVWHPAVAVIPPVEGKAAVREMLEGLAGQVARSEWRIVRHAEAGNLLFLEGIDANELIDGTRAEIPYAGVVEFEGDLVRGWRDYFDGATFGKAMAGKPLPAWLAPLMASAD